VPWKTALADTPYFGGVTSAGTVLVTETFRQALVVHFLLVLVVAANIGFMKIRFDRVVK